MFGGYKASVAQTVYWYLGKGYYNVRIMPNRPVPVLAGCVCEGGGVHGGHVNLLRME